MFWVYIIKSLSTQKFYVGHTEDLERRLHEHNTGINRSTKSGKPWELVWRKSCDSRAEAMKLETSIKKKKSSKYISWLITQLD
ncbi:MAG: GIY-YIG nuclease family protein [Chitinophagales bacterium]|nr:GIY-YIG nuclease family protein [Chitinophagales bacterium]